MSLGGRLKESFVGLMVYFVAASNSNKKRLLKSTEIDPRDMDLDNHFNQQRKRLNTSQKSRASKRFESSSTKNYFNC